MADLTVGEAIREKREAIIHIAARHGAIQVRLIGSIARGDARPDSDVDLLATWSEAFILAIGQVDDGRQKLVYIRQPFQQEPEFAVESVNYNLQELLARAEDAR